MASVMPMRGLLEMIRVMNVMPMMSLMALIFVMFIWLNGEYTIDGREVHDGLDNVMLTVMEPRKIKTIPI